MTKGARLPVLIRLVLYLVAGGGIWMALLFLSAAFAAGKSRDSTLILCFLAGLLSSLLIAQMASNNAAAVRWRGRSDGWKLAGATAGLLVGLWALSVADERMRWPGYRAPMLSDLRRLVAAESVYHAGHGSYTPELSALDPPFPTTTGVRLLITADVSGWQATAQYERTRRTCQIAVQPFAGRQRVTGPTCTK